MFLHICSFLCPYSGNAVGVLGVWGMVIRLFVSHKSFRFFFLPL